jgi:hypothetical protein
MNELRTLQYIPFTLIDICWVGNPLDTEWPLSCEQIHQKNIQLRINKMNKLKLLHRRKIIYNCWVSYFDTPNDDDIAKHAILLYKQ